MGSHLLYSSAIMPDGPAITTLQNSPDVKDIGGDEEGMRPRDYHPVMWFRRRREKDEEGTI
jgi:hypothetical protein